MKKEINKYEEWFFSHKNMVEELLESIMYKIKLKNKTAEMTADEKYNISKNDKKLASTDS